MKQIGWVLLALLGAQAGAASAATQRYVVVFNQSNNLPSNAERAVQAAGGSIQGRLDAVGAVAVESSNPNFIADIEANPVVKAASLDELLLTIPERGLSALDRDAAATENNGGTITSPGADPQPMPDSLGSQQWDKMRMNSTLTGSYAVQRGRRDVRVAVLDTGAEVLPVPHPDIAPNLNFAESRSFVLPSGAYNGLAEGDPNPASWDDKVGHGSWCLSAVGAPINAIGVSGVAPNVTLVALKVLGDTGSGSFFALAAALVYAGNHHYDVASMSLSGFLQHAKHGQALVTIVQRASDYARSNGVLPIAALGNDGFNLSDGNFVQSFLNVPAELPGVVGVAATGYYNQKAFYSNYGVDATDVSAPGGSTRNYTGVPGSGAPPPPYLGIGRVLGAWSAENTDALPSNPDNYFQHCVDPDGSGVVCAYYAWVQGTSMATPNAAGVAALIISQYGDFAGNNPNKPHMSPQQVESFLQTSANNQPCPDPRTVIQGPGLLIPTATCSGASGGGNGAGYTDFFGKGIVDALKAVTLKPGQAAL
ncbi:S8 family serine peptidase [Aggregicoccus sp. 17bor-14]|uniref:S8 family peptidase n=1 Tax=Myxococcaceae TaxID=31 RepID=UPI00129C437B|nr:MULTISPECIES: S8 family serine peptidase [Myxococcaceae]MBF5043815.1 S8 family serine peptidase [Simulacricoccus sp. 17bor-14]MRI89567.1 S8 family serine peptidase [Aggregicoccus sp. 17bor-14]